ncbi:hypothetical protein [Sutterella sp.]|uniref:hypothetical protein n=1 Tax=Sutterella sp. TaxID=1981025 RepID=UPI0026DFB2D2|nr:hypothetical protein [Sutterella sp.]MDO5531064.1 hypothetical protein [Sutterella sp.]
MTTSKVIQRSFTGGEISPRMHGRIDHTTYQTGLEECLNAFILPQGPVQNRPGFAYVNACKYPGKATRLIPFTFSESQTMVIELGDKYARFHTDGQTLMNAAGTAPYEIATPWAAEHLFELHYVQSGDVMTIVHHYYPPTELRRYSAQDWRVAEVSFDPKLSTPTGVTAVRATAAESDSNAEKYTFKYKVAALSSDKLYESKPSDAVEVVANLYATGTTVRVSWNAVSGAEFYRVYKYQGGLYGCIGDTEDTYLIDDDIDADLSITPRRFGTAFTASGGIESVTINSGGTGYSSFKKGIAATPSATTYGSLGLTSSSSNVFESVVSSLTGSSSTKYLSVATHALQSSGSYPSTYPTFTLEVYDEQGQGSGAVVEPVIEYTTGTSYDRWNAGGQSADSRDYRTVYYYKNIATLTGFTIKNPGHGYITPKLKVTYTCTTTRRGSISSASGTGTASLNTQDVSPVFNVEELSSSGSGATLEAVVTDGVITAVNVLTGGSGYSSPTITVTDPLGVGSGASFTAVVSSTGDYPSAVTYFEQRRWFGGTPNLPTKLWATRTGTEDDLSYSLPSVDDDRLEAQISARTFSKIRHLAALAHLMVLTGDSELRISPLNSDAITPDSISARPQSYIGSNDVQPVTINSALIYCDSMGGHLHEFAYNDSAGGYVSGDLCLLAPHLFDYRQVVDMAFMRAPFPVIWCVSSSGQLLGLTYVPEQQVGAWHRHETDGAFESVACVAEDDETALYAVVRRTIQDSVVRYVERLSTRQFENLEDCFFVDSGGTYRGAETTTVSGLTWLEGRTVSILADGAVLPQQTVTDGTITLEVPASVVHVGLPYTTEVKSLPTVLQKEGYGMGEPKNVSEVAIRLYESSGIWVGYSDSTLKKYDAETERFAEYAQRTTEQPGTAPARVTGEIRIKPPVRWSDGGQICLKQDDPLPLEISSIAMTVAS